VLEEHRFAKDQYKQAVAWSYDPEGRT
jgi:hypothetical protein